MPVNLWVWIDPTRQCNLSCELCYTKISHARSNLSLENLSIIIEKLKDPRVLIRQLHLNWRGEPLMNPKFPELLRFTLERSAANVQWHTNGILLSGRAREIVRATSRTHLVYVSIDGGNSLTHDGNRGAGTFRRTLNGLAVLLEERRFSPVRVGVYQLDLGLPVRDYDPEFLELATQCDEWVRVKPVQHEIVNVQPDADREHRLLGPCFWAGNSFSIDPVGEVSICLLSHSEHGVIGNILKEDLGVLLERAGTWRERLAAEGRQAVKHCQSCRKSEGAAFAQDLLPPAVSRRP